MARTIFISVTHASIRRTNQMSLSEGTSPILEPKPSVPAVISGVNTNLEAIMAAI